MQRLNVSTLTDIIHTKLAILEPIEIVLINDSHQHIGHSGANDTGETHFSLRIVSDHFLGKSTIQRHKIIYSLLSDELKNSIHALSIKALTRNEYQANSQN